MSMTILGIDPGPKESAYVWWNGRLILGKGVELNGHILNGPPAPGTQIACEHLQCFGMSVGAETFETAYWIGEDRRICSTYSIPFHRVFRSQIKMHFCNSMRAKSPNIRQALIDRFGGKGTKK